MKLRLFRDQFFYNISKIFRKCLAYFRTGILTGCPFAHLDQTVQLNFIPVFHMLLGPLYLLCLLFWIINQSSQLLLFPLPKRISKYILDFASHRTGSILQHMGKRLPFPMNVRQKMLGSFRKIQDRLQIDDLCRSRRDRRIQIRQPLQISCL